MKEYKGQMDIRIKKVLDKMSKEDRETLAEAIGGECNFYSANYLKPQSEARISSICDFTEYLQEFFDFKTAMQRCNDTIDRVFGDMMRKSHLKRIK